MRLLSYDDLKATKGVPYSKAQLWRLERVHKFPKRIPLGNGGRHGWLETEIDKWINDRVKARDSTLVPPAGDIGS